MYMEGGRGGGVWAQAHGAPAHFHFTPPVGIPTV